MPQPPRGLNDPAWFEPYRELGYREALERARVEARLVRVLRPGDMSFSDLVFGRLNLQIDAEKNLLKIFPG